MILRKTYKVWWRGLVTAGDVKYDGFAAFAVTDFAFVLAEIVFLPKL